MFDINDFSKTELNTNMRDIGLSVRVRNALLQKEINTVYELLHAIKNNGLIGLRNIGKTIILEIVNTIENMHQIKHITNYAKICALEQQKHAIQEQTNKFYDSQIRALQQIKK